MSAVFQDRGAPIALRVFSSLQTCGGAGVVLGRDPGQPPVVAATSEVELALASRLGEREARGEQAATVVLRMHARDDAAWVASAMPWLVDRGRRVIVRTPAVLPRSLAAAARDRGVTVFLEVASVDPDVQRALLGAGADPVANLLLHAQHLRALGVELSAFIGPLLPVLHDRPAALERLFRHIAAADIRDARLSVGRLNTTRLHALQHALPWGSATAIARAFGATEHSGALLPANGARLDRTSESTLFHSVRRVAEHIGVRVDHCGCAAHCHLAQARPHPYRQLLTSDLFQTA